jgi:lipopolysaccharide/colanic/teichoic acid biosynthesis glycosyltransferase
MQRRFAVKYGIDRVVSLLALVLLAPLLLMIATAVALSSRGPVLFRQRRVSLNGRIFELYKFRTMRDQPAHTTFAPQRGTAPGGVEGTDRRTRLGRLLRASSLDELPQLLNVLRGEMSLVGPRPERPEFAERFAVEVPGYGDRHRVKCGITGWAQANGLRGQTSLAERAAYDNHYIDNWSPALELRTVALTVIEVLRFRDGAPRCTQPDNTCATSASIAARVAFHSRRTASTAVTSIAPPTGASSPAAPASR